MSFDYNPFRHIEIIEVEPGWHQVHCHSCGGMIGSLLDSSAPISVFQNVMRRHVENSHQRTEADFDGWSIQ